MLKNLKQKIESHRHSKNMFWIGLVCLKDIIWVTIILPKYFSRKICQLIIFFKKILFLKVSEKGLWIHKMKKIDDAFDPGLANEALKFLKREGCGSLADFGCGQGRYVGYFNKNGINAVGYDGNPHTRKICAQQCFVLDLSQKISLGKKFDWILSLEVGEHIPVKYEDNFIENIINHCSRGVILSWAAVGQKGTGHVNCKNADDVKKKFKKIGMANDLSEENKLKNMAGCSHIRNNIMVFRKTQ